MKKRLKSAIAVLLLAALAVPCLTPSMKTEARTYRYDGFTNDAQISEKKYTANKKKYPNIFQMKLAGPGLTAWDYATGEGVNVAIFDGGINLKDKELKGQIKGCYNAVLKKEGTKYISNVSHGTSVAKIMAAAGNNKYAGAGVAYDVNLYFVQVDAEGDQASYSKSVIEGIRYAVRKKCRIICMSLSDTVKDTKMEKAINNAYSREKNSVLFLASGGNTAKEQYRYPSSYKNVMAVAAATYSSGKYSPMKKGTYNSRINIAAPGNSTSAATAYAAGVAALIFQLDPSLTAKQCAGVMKSTAKDIGKKGRDKRSGYGLVQPLPAVQKAMFRTVTLRSAKKSDTGGILVKWKKNSKAFGYQIQVSANKNFTNVKKYNADDSVSSKEIIPPGEKKVYYVRMRAYTMVDETKLYSAYSNVKQVKM